MRLNVASRTGHAGLVALSLGVAVYALVAYALLPLGAVVHPDMRAGLEAQRAALYAHVFVGGIAGLYMALHSAGGPVARVGFAYPVVAWLCWVPNLVVAELAFVARRESVR